MSTPRRKAERSAKPPSFPPSPKTSPIMCCWITVKRFKLFIRLLLFEVLESLTLFREAMPYNNPAALERNQVSGEMQRLSEFGERERYTEEICSLNLSVYSSNQSSKNG